MSQRISISLEKSSYNSVIHIRQNYKVSEKNDGAIGRLNTFRAESFRIRSPQGTKKRSLNMTEAPERCEIARDRNRFAPLFCINITQNHIWADQREMPN